MTGTKIHTGLLNLIHKSNVLSNGGFEKWNAGIFFQSPLTSLIPTADKWLNQNVNATFTITQEPTNIDLGLFSAKVDITVGPSNSFVSLEQSIPDFKNYRGKTVAIRVRVRANSGAKIRAFIGDGVNPNSVSSFHSGGDTFENLDVIHAVSSTASSLRIVIGQIESVNDFGVVTFYVDSAMLVVGDEAVDFQPEHDEIDELKVGRASLAALNIPNIIEGGGFERWPFGVLFTNPRGAVPILPGWTVINDGTPVSTIVSDLTNFESGRRSLAVDITGVGGATTYQLEQNISRSEPEVYRNREITVSCRVRSNVAGIKLRVNADSNTLSEPHTGTGGFETLSVTVTLGALSVLRIQIGFLDTVPVISQWNIDNVMMTFGSAIVPYVPQNSDLSGFKNGLLEVFRDNIPNIVFNGGFEIWERGTIFNNPAHNAFAADGWRVNTAGASPTHVISKDTTPANVFIGASSMKLDLTVISGAAEYYVVQEPESGLNRFPSKFISASVWIKTSIPAKIRLRILDAAGGSNSNFSQYHSGSGNYELLVASRLIGASGLANVAVGTFTPDAVVTGIFFVDAFMVVRGRQPVDFVVGDPGVEQARAERLFEKHDGFGFTWLPNSLVFWSRDFHFRTTKKAIPAITFNGGSLTGVNSVTPINIRRQVFSADMITDGTITRKHVGNGETATYEAEAI